MYWSQSDLRVSPLASSDFTIYEEQCGIFLIFGKSPHFSIYLYFFYNRFHFCRKCSVWGNRNVSVIKKMSLICTREETKSERGFGGHCSSVGKFAVITGGLFVSEHQVCSMGESVWLHSWPVELTILHQTRLQYLRQPWQIGLFQFCELFLESDWQREKLESEEVFSLIYYSLHSFLPLTPTLGVTLGRFGLDKRRKVGF